MSDEQRIVDLTQVSMEDLDKLRNRNMQKLQAVGQFGAAIDTNSVAAIRLDTYLDLALNDEQRIQFEFAFETRMSEQLDKVLAQARAHALTQGVSNAVAQNPKLIVPGRS